MSIVYGTYFGISELIVYTLQIVTLGLPELDLDTRGRVQPINERLGRVSLQHISDLM